jgi:hypothetical protein
MAVELSQMARIINDHKNVYIEENFEYFIGILQDDELFDVPVIEYPEGEGGTDTRAIDLLLLQTVSSGQWHHREHFERVLKAMHRVANFGDSLLKRGVESESLTRSRNQHTQSFKSLRNNLDICIHMADSSKSNYYAVAFFDQMERQGHNRVRGE